jgi:hypothetical protein
MSVFMIATCCHSPMVMAGLHCGGFAAAAGGRLAGRRAWRGTGFAERRARSLEQGARWSGRRR